ncbi:uncharacterized protein PgNI_03188, partial [Pyricularia grisea]|uniref:Uncharacterized protein n=1 Tax=Pyricularia grisea TaxID=148305 RepID=A0A6P8BDC8_PYRGI
LANHPRRRYPSKHEPASSGVLREKKKRLSFRTLTWLTGFVPLDSRLSTFFSSSSIDL